jgi:hypothetical protein
VTATPALSVKVNENDVAHWYAGSFEAVTGADDGLVTIVRVGDVVGLVDVVGVVVEVDEPPHAPTDNAASVTATIVIPRNIDSLPVPDPTHRGLSPARPAPSYCPGVASRFPLRNGARDEGITTMSLSTLIL